MRQGSGDDGNTEKVKVYLRIRPLTQMERDKGEEQVRPCSGIQDHCSCDACAHLLILVAVLTGSSLLCQGCVAVEDEETLLLKAPKDSQNMRTAERGITQSMHKFSFSKVRVCTVSKYTISFQPEIILNLFKSA